MTSRFGTRLRQLRLEAGLTQEGMADRSGVSVRTIRGLETGQRAEPRMATVRRLADTLDLKPGERQELLDAAVGPIRPEPAPTDSALEQPADPVVEESAGPVVEEPAASVVEQPFDPLAAATNELAQAVRARWQREEELRQIQDPFPLPVRWRHALEQTTDHWTNICGVPPGGEAAPLDLTGQLTEVVDVYRRIPSGRLVVLGEAGSGKTILTLRFVLDLLNLRGHSDAVPVIFSIGSWNPVTTALRDWLTDRLARDYGLVAPGPGGSTLEAALVDGGRILPVLDGFDEIAAGLHRAALDALSKNPMPLVLTSRPDEYTDAVRATDVLTAAAAVHLTGLTLADLTDYLPRTTRRTSANDSATPVWNPVLTELRDHPRRATSSNLATVFTTPLMVALARAIYSDTPGRDPAELLDANRFDTPESLEDHLLGDFIPTVYRTQPGPQRHWDLDRVRHWLGYLAQHLDQLGTRDLAWWELGTAMRRSSRVLVVALVVGLLNGLVNGLGDGLGDGLAAGLGSGLAGGLATGVAFGLAHALALVFGAAVFEPSRVRIQILGRTTGVRASFVRRFALGIAAGLAGGLVLGLAGGVSAEIIGGHGAGLTGGLGVGLALGVVCGLVAGLMGRFEVPIDVHATASPTDLLRANRTTVLFQSLVWAPVFGLGAGLLDGLVFGLVVGFGVGIGYGLSLTAWGQWVTLARLWLPLTGRLPWAVTAFLDDACRRGVLRQAGAVYQFRHARLQDQLTRSR
ncbi:helix-turn-helix domain-containing protein [Solihabitans fulvus]|uniref:Helix-turn-helix domain-containing protein n=1 Tax=Solihabitans fulvus TaxID=1892852 RepID=A0A5B2XFV6_9PSEU|nr:helix-turn-helix transcriptional regulator [Solihabitans fulvus]KAA2262708.1 helix-turn-helix domain-containing protein [Solihabitans fulvus]